MFRSATLRCGIFLPHTSAQKRQRPAGKPDLCRMQGRIMPAKPRQYEIF